MQTDVSTRPAAQQEGEVANAVFESPFAVVTLDVGGTKIGGAIVRYENRHATPAVLLNRAVPTEAKRGGAAVTQTICDVARGLLADVASCPELDGCPVIGVGVGTAGRVDAQTGTIAYANDIMPGWMGQPLGDRLKDACKLPVAVMNDVQAHGLGEARHGAAAGSHTCIMVAVGTGLGGTLVFEGRIMGGAHGFAGELGCSLHPMAGNVSCEGGITGRLESIASGSGIERCYRAGGGEALSGPEISARAAEGERLARRVIEQAGFSLGESIISWANIFDPDLVVISGSVCKSGPLWREALRKGMEAQMTSAVSGLRVVDASLGANAPLLGAAENLLDRLEERHTRLAGLRK